MSITFKPSNVEVTKPRTPTENKSAIMDKDPSKMQSSFETIIKQSPLEHPVAHGFIYSVKEAYNNHHALIIRPEDVWLAILTQFSIYVGKNAEALRSHFVTHSGKKELEVIGDGNLRTADYEKLSILMGNEIQKNVVPNVQNWIVPNFSTTTKIDRMVASVVLMASMKKYFTYKYTLRCGLPEVTLLGTKEDWEDLYSRAKMLVKYEVEANSNDSIIQKWYKLLEPVLKNFVETASGKPNLEWWNKCCHYNGGSGIHYLTGWITVFSVFDENEEWIGDNFKVATMFGTITSEWPIIDSNKLASGSVTVDITVDDNGKIYNTVMVAGSMGVSIVGNSLQPVTGYKLSLK